MNSKTFDFTETDMKTLMTAVMLTIAIRLRHMPKPDPLRRQRRSTAAPSHKL